jgi:hypothetical protein
MNASFLWQTQIFERIQMRIGRERSNPCSRCLFFPVARPWRSWTICVDLENEGRSAEISRASGSERYCSGLEEIAHSQRGIKQHKAKRFRRLTQAKASHPKQATAHDVMFHHVINEMSGHVTYIKSPDFGLGSPQSNRLSGEDAMSSLLLRSNTYHFAFDQLLI